MKQNTKDWIQYSSALLLIFSAVAMAFVSLALTMEVGSGPLAYIAEALSAALAIFGIGAYVVNKVGEMKREIREELEQMRTGQTNIANETDDNETDENERQRQAAHKGF